MTDRPFAHVRLVPLPSGPTAIADGSALLDADERVRAARFQNDAARLQFIVGHAAVRKLLSEHAAVAPEDWRFVRGPYGKPSAVAPDGSAGPPFSLSHTDGLIAVAVSTGGPVGIDVERVRPVEVDHFSSVLSRTESAEFLAIEPGQRDRRFFDIWTAKEAFAKATAKGLSESLRHVTVRDAATRPTLIGFAGEANWQIHRIDAGDAHAAAVAFDGDAVVTVTHGE